MFNLDFSGLFGGGGFALDTSKFNFDAYKAPEAKKEAVVDPVDVVSDKSPTPDVEVLEGAGTVAVTKPDPITQAIEALKGKDLSNDFNVNPIAPTPVAIQPVIPTPVAPTPVAPTVSPTDSVPIVAPQPVKQPPKVVTRPDPVAIVTQQSDPIADAIASVQSDVVIPDLTSAPMGMDFGIAPITKATMPNIGNISYDVLPNLSPPEAFEEPSAIGEDGKYQEWTADPKFDNASIGNGFSMDFDLPYTLEELSDPNRQKSTFELYQDAQARRGDEVNAFIGEKQNEIFTNLGVQPVKEPLFTQQNRFPVPKVTADDATGLAVMVGEDYLSFVNNLLASEESSKYAEQMAGVKNDFYDTSEEDAIQYSKLDYLKDLGLVNTSGGGGTDAFALEGKYGGYSLYEYNPESNQYEKTFDKEDSALEAAIPVAANAVLTAASIYIGGQMIMPQVSAAVSATGAEGVTASAVTKMATNAIAQQVITGKINPVEVASAGITGGLEAAQEASNIANSDLAGAFSDFGADSVEYANALTAANEADSVLEITNNIKTAADLTKAVEDKNLLQAFDLTSSLLDSPSLNSTVKNQLTGVVPDEFLDEATVSFIKAGDTAIKGGDVKEVIQDFGNSLLSQTVATPQAIAEQFGLEEDGWGSVAANTLSEMTIEALDGGNKEDILKSGVKEFIDNVSVTVEFTDDGEDGILKQAEDWWHENIEDPAESFWQEIEPIREVIEESGQAAIDTVKNAGQGAVDIVDAAIRAVPTTKEDWQEAETFVKENTAALREDFSNLNRDVRQELADFDETYLQPIKEDMSQINEQVREDLANFDETYLQPIKEDMSNLNQDVRDQLANFDSEELQPIKKDIEKVISTVDEKLSNFNKDYIKPIDQYLSDANAEFRDRLSDFEDDYIDPVKEDVEGLANDIKEGLSDANEYTREQLANFDDSVLQPIKNDIESLIEGLGSDMGGMGDMLSDLWDMVNGIGNGLAATQERVGRPSADKSPLVKMRTQYGEQYEFEDLRNNPLLNNEFLS